ncbi:MAG: protein-methionine-sulfoxide reductase catalytic subunit MsrP [Deltaproteobacteria bacterium]|nr:protein-methionine-sulfoxide reductase catalytic subunit MsrP [Deltaproteobacteria bacterium]
MLIKKNKPWLIPEREATPEAVYMDRRRFLRFSGALGLSAGFLLTGGASVSGFFDLFSGGGSGGGRPRPPRTTPSSHLYPARRNPAYTLDRPLTDEKTASVYNNFYEFSSRKNDVWSLSSGLITRPWTVEITGLVEKPRIYDIDELTRLVKLEERFYRFRCVEAWAMAVPWTGFPMTELLRIARPLSSAGYVRMRTFMNKDWAPQQRLQVWLPWPYEEGLTMEEASNELAFLATGIYGHELPNQHGAPMRLVVPWKYGFKSIKSIVRIEFTDARPKTFWNTLAPDEYDFTANVDPSVPHPRWSQAKERMVDTGETRPTIKYNGYAEYVAGLYGKR